MADSTAKNKILVLGRPEADKARLVSGVISQDAASAADESARIEWQIETRYYQAAVEFWIDSTEQLADSHIEYMRKWLSEPNSRTPTCDDEESSVGGAGALALDIPIDEGMVQLQEHLSEVVDAVVFVFDPTEPDTFHDILPWARYSAMYQPGVLLCVAALGRGGKTAAVVDDSLKDSWFVWCVANGWEWVDLTDTDPDTEYTVDRIREALVSNEWANMVAKQGSRSTIEAAAARPLAETQDAPVANADVSSSSSNELRPEGAKEQEEWDRFDRVVQNLNQTRVDSLHRSLFALGSGTANDGELADDSDDMAAVLSKISSMRDQISQMSPEQARIKAAELAMAVAKKL
ncbi:hypothetical protein GQ54DRAFT_220474 [Martensiomyces pterosporus]|nr:hypothetical protein GQ54DRAFT_220474 [Martensiomyces pterosporus]